MNTTTTVPLLAQADLLLLIGRLLKRPDEALRTRLMDALLDVEALVVSTELPDQENLLHGLRDTLGEVVDLSLEDWSAERTRLFECSVACPIGETAYIRRDKGAILADIRGFYLAFGLELNEADEKADYLITELEFVSLLLVMLANARAEENVENAEVTHDALSAFVTDHLGEWLGGFCLRLEANAELPLFTKVAKLLLLTVGMFCDHHGFTIGGKVLPTVDENPGTPYECDMAQQGQA